MTEKGEIIYADYNGTTPVAPEAISAMMPYFQTHWGNASSGHVLGDAPRAALARAKRQIAALIGAESQTADESVVLLSGGTEALNLAIKGVAQTAFEKDPSALRHIIGTEIEHDAVLETLESVSKLFKVSISLAKPNESGVVLAENVVSLVRPETFMVCVMLANNETGVIQPVREIKDSLRKIGRDDVLLLVDASQAIGKIRVNVVELDADFLTIAGHKVYAPKGVGALYVKPHKKKLLTKQMHGAGQENGIRAGTENVALSVSLGTACQMLTEDFDQINSKLLQLKERLLECLKEEYGKFRPGQWGNEFIDGATTLPNTISISFRGVNAKEILNDLRQVLAASAGAACHSTGSVSSKVLKAMNIPYDFARGTFRLSLGKYNTFKEMEQIASILVEAVSLKKGKEGSKL